MSDGPTSPADEVPSAKGSQRRRRVRRLALVVLIVAVVLVAAAPALLRGLGSWLVVSDELAEADAIFVHAGHMPVRVLEAADLFLEGMAREVWLADTVPTEERAALEEVGVVVPAEWHWNREVLLARGVPVGAIRLLPALVATTRDEVGLVAKEMERSGGRRVILVTSRQHSRRVSTLWRRAGPRGLEAIVRPSRHDPFDPTRWWTNTDDGEAVLHELLGIVDAWVDVGLRPERSP